MYILKKVSFIYNILTNLLHYSFESYHYHSLGTISMILLFLILLYIPSYAYGNELYSINKTTLQKDQFGYLHLFGEIKNNSEKIDKHNFKCQLYRL